MRKSTVTSEVVVRGRDDATVPLRKAASALASLEKRNARLITAIKRLARENGRLRKSMRDTRKDVGKLAQRNRELAGELRTASAAARRFERENQRLNNRLYLANQKAETLRRGLSGVGKQAVVTQGYVEGFGKSLIVWYAAISGSRALINAVNQMDAVANRLRALTGSESQVRRLQAALFDIAHETRQGYKGVATFYSRVAFAMRDTAVSAEELQRVTKIVNQLMIASGTNATEAQAAMIQFSQALASGRLAGEEYRSIAEQVPILLDVIAKHAGVTRKEIQGLARAQKLTTDLILPAILAFEDKAQAMFDKTHVTLAQGWDMVKNGILQYIDAANKSLDVSKKLGAALAEVSEHMRHVINLLLGVGGAVLAMRMFSKSLAAAGVAAGALKIAMRGLKVLLLIEGVLYAWQLLSGEFDKAKERIDDVVDATSKLVEKNEDLHKVSLKAMRLDYIRLGEEIAKVNEEISRMEQGDHAIGRHAGTGGQQALSWSGKSIAELKKRREELSKLQDDMINNLQAVRDAQDEAQWNEAWTKASKERMELVGEEIEILKVRAYWGQKRIEMEAKAAEKKAAPVVADPIDEALARIRDRTKTAAEQYEDLLAEMGENKMIILREQWQAEDAEEKARDERKKEEERAAHELRMEHLRAAHEHEWALEKAHNDRLTQMQELAQSRKVKAQMTYQGAALGMARAFFAHNEKLAFAMDALDTAIQYVKAVKAAHVAYALALAQPPGPPLTGPFAAAVLTAGLANAKAILATGLVGMGVKAAGMAGAKAFGGDAGGVVGDLPGTAVGVNEDAEPTRNITINVKKGHYDQETIIELSQELAQAFGGNGDTNLTVRRIA